jgi:hypothetical protein
MIQQAPGAQNRTAARCNLTRVEAILRTRSVLSKRALPAHKLLAAFTSITTISIGDLGEIQGRFGSSRSERPTACVKSSYSN